METCYTREQIEKAVKSKGYKWFEDTNNKEFRLHGTHIPAKLVQELLQFNF